MGLHTLITKQTQPPFEVPLPELIEIPLPELVEGKAHKLRCIANVMHLFLNV